MGLHFLSQSKVDRRRLDLNGGRLSCAMHMRGGPGYVESNLNCTFPVSVARAQPMDVGCVDGIEGEKGVVS